MRNKIYYAVGAILFVLSGLYYMVFSPELSNNAVFFIGAYLFIEGAIFCLKLYREYKGKRVSDKLLDEE